MKPAYRDSALLYDDKGRFLGVNLGWDFTAEHEWGIKGIREDNLSNGWCKITYKGMGVGLGKITANCIKNHYPKGLRNMQ